MNRNNFEREWENVRSDVQIKWNKLTDEDIEMINGDYEQLIATIEQRYNCSRAQAEREIQNWKSEERGFERGEERNTNAFGQNRPTQKNQRNENRQPNRSLTNRETDREQWNQNRQSDKNQWDQNQKKRKAS